MFNALRVKHGNGQEALHEHSGKEATPIVAPTNTTIIDCIATNARCRQRGVAADPINPWPKQRNKGE